MKDFRHELNRTGIPTPRNAVREYKRKKPLDADAEWMPTSLTKILKSPNIVGQVTVNGIAVTRAEPLIDIETWEHVKQILARNAVRTGPKINQSPLLHVLFCMLCKAPMYIATASYTTAAGETKNYRYYCCTAANRKRGCNARRVDADEVERHVGDRMIASIGDLPRAEDEIIPGRDNSAAIAEMAEAIGELSSQKAMAMDTSGIETQIQAREAELARLAAEPARPAYSASLANWPRITSGPPYGIRSAASPMTNQQNGQSSPSSICCRCIRATTSRSTASAGRSGLPDVMIARAYSSTWISPVRHRASQL